MVNDESLKARTLFGSFSNPVKDELDNLLSVRVVAGRVVVCAVFLSADHALFVEQVFVRTRSNLVHDRRLEVHADGARHVFPGSRVLKERLVGVVLRLALLGQHPVWPDPVLQAE
jgi:hypothetical protein